MAGEPDANLRVRVAIARPVNFGYGPKSWYAQTN